MSIYIYKNNKQSGPFEETAVSAWLQSGQLSPEDMACRQGSREWQPLKALFPDGQNIRQQFPRQNFTNAGASARVGGAIKPEQKKGGGSKTFLFLLLGLGALVLVGAVGVAALFFTGRTNRTVISSNFSNGNPNTNSSNANVNSTNSNSPAPNYKELSDKLKDFAKLKPPVKLEKAPGLKGKILIVEQRDRENEYSLKMLSTSDMSKYGLSGDRSAANLAELDTLVQTVCGKGKEIGRYGPRMAYVPLYSNVCNVSIIDYRTPKTIAQKSFVNGKKPKTIHVTDDENESVLEPPLEDVEKYLSGLPKQ